MKQNPWLELALWGIDATVENIRSSQIGARAQSMLLA